MFSLISMLFQPQVPEIPVRATLADGQILMGEVETRTLRLATGAGIVEVPLADVGEVIPASGEALGIAEGVVNVWLRNGSELRGRWSEPELDIGIMVGGGSVGINLPMNELSRFQLAGGERWPEGAVYRMRTSWGDDFLVDPSLTTLVLENALGTFSPRLDECRYLAPVGDPTGDWRVELNTGTVLIGALRDDSLTLALPMGPEQITVSLANFVSLKLERWGQPGGYRAREEERPSGVSPVREPMSDRGQGAVAAPMVAASGSADDEAALAAPRRGASAPAAQESSGAPWFEADAFKASKEAAE